MLLITSQVFLIVYVLCLTLYSYPRGETVDVEDVHRLLSSLVEIVLKSTTVDQVGLACEAILYVAKVMMGQDTSTFGKLDINAFKSYMAQLTERFLTSSSLIPASFFEQLALRFPMLAWHTLSSICDNMPKCMNNFHKFTAVNMMVAVVRMKASLKDNYSVFLSLRKSLNAALADFFATKGVKTKHFRVGLGLLKTVLTLSHTQDTQKKVSCSHLPLTRYWWDLSSALSSVVLTHLRRVQSSVHALLRRPRRVSVLLSTPPSLF